MQSTTDAEEGALPPDGAEAGVSERERQIVLWLNNVNHMLNHFQNQMVYPMYPTIARELGMGPLELGLLTTARNVFNNWAQLGYGFLTPFVQRFQLLGITSLIYALGTFLSGTAWNFGSFLGIRCIAAAGSSAMHPVGTSLLASYFRKNRGTILALNSTMSQVGSIIAPLAGGFLLIVLGWRQTFFVVAILSIFMALAYFFFRDRIRDTGKTSDSNRAKLAKSKQSYLRVLRNPNVMLVSLIMLVGGGGRGEVVPTYVGLHFENDFGFQTAFTVFALFVYQLGGLLGPLSFGWVSDRTSRKGVMQVSLVLSGLATLWLAWQGANPVLLLLSMAAYGV